MEDHEEVRIIPILFGENVQEVVYRKNLLLETLENDI